MICVEQPTCRCGTGLGTKPTTTPSERLARIQEPKPIPVPVNMGNRAPATLSAPPSNWTVPFSWGAGCCCCCTLLYTWVILYVGCGTNCGKPVYIGTYGAGL